MVIYKNTNTKIKDYNHTIIELTFPEIKFNNKLARNAVGWEVEEDYNIFYCSANTQLYCSRCVGFFYLNISILGFGFIFNKQIGY